MQQSDYGQQAQHPDQYREHYLEMPEALGTKFQVSSVNVQIHCVARVQFCFLLLVLYLKEAGGR